MERSLNLKNSVCAGLSLLLQDLEEDDVEESSGGQSLEDRDQRTLKRRLGLHRLGKADADSGSDDSHQRKGANVEGAKPRFDAWKLKQTFFT